MRIFDSCEMSKTERQGKRENDFVFASSCPKLMRTDLPWLQARKTKNVTKIRSVKAQKCDPNFMRYLLSSDDLLEQIKGYVTRAQARSSKPPIEIQMILRWIEEGRRFPGSSNLMD